MLVNCPKLAVGINSCSPFIYIENLIPEPDSKSEKSDSPLPPTKKSRNDLRKDAHLVKQLRLAAEQSSGDDGWSYMGQVAKYISNNSSFSPLNYGYAKLSDLIKACELFEIDMRSNGSAMYIKDARK